MFNNLTLKKIFGHLKTIHTHRKWVRHYCFLAGIPWRGLTHDLSKYSPVEFWESVKFWCSTRSPIEIAKENQGYSLAWLHHRGHNRHHWEYWYDDFEKGGIARLIPKKDFTELVCDYLGAAHAYEKQGFSFAHELHWWKTKRDKVKMNKLNIKMLDMIFSSFAEMEMQDEVYDVFDDKDIEYSIKDGFIQYVYDKVIYENKSLD